MDNDLEQQSGRESVSDDRNSVKECCTKPSEVHTDDSNPNCVGTNMEISDKNDPVTDVHYKSDTENCNVMDLLVKLGNDTAVYNISKSLERVRYMINSISAEGMLASPILPHQRCVTYVSQAQKTIRGSQKLNEFKFVSSYPSSMLNRKYRVRTGTPIIIIGDVTNIKEDQCSYVFICAYVNEFATLNSKAANALGLVDAYSSSADVSNDSYDDSSSTVDSSEDSSDSSDTSSSVESDNENIANSKKIVKKREDFKPLAVDVRNPLVFLEDGAADKLPPVRECDIKVLRQDCVKIGYVMHLHELLVSVQGLKDSPALNADTLLFLEDNEDDKSLRSLGFVYEVIGPVDEPVYCITFKEEQNIKKKQVKQGESVYICPSPEYTHFVFVQDLLKQKGSDASWKNDVEPPEQFIEYSDDEEERLAKQRLKQASSNEPSTNATVKRKITEGNKPEKARVYKRKRAMQTGIVSSHSTEVNGEVDNQCIPSSRSRGHQGISGSYRGTGRAQQMPHAAQSNGEVGNRRIPCLVSSGSDTQHGAVGSYRGQGQRTLRTVQVNGVEPPAMQQHGYTVQPMLIRPAGPPRMQHCPPAPAVNRHFLPAPSAVFPSNQRFTPPLQQQQFYFNSPSHPFPASQRQFYNPPQ